LPKIFLMPHYSGAPGARGPGSLNRLNPPVPTPLVVIRFSHEEENNFRRQVWSLLLNWRRLDAN